MYGYSCGYCGVRESDAGSRLTLDHFRPRSSGGEDDFDNLVYCCHGCNEFKSDYWHIEENHRLLHPLRGDVALHLAPFEDGTVRALTARGNIHIAQLRLNRAELVAYRIQRQTEDALSREYRKILNLLDATRQDNEVLREQISGKDLTGQRE
jgi:hypothetical protein